MIRKGFRDKKAFGVKLHVTRLDDSYSLLGLLREVQKSRKSRTQVGMQGCGEQTGDTFSGGDKCASII
jgi:hypothetical protein